MTQSPRAVLPCFRFAVFPLLVSENNSLMRPYMWVFIKDYEPVRLVASTSCNATSPQPPTPSHYQQGIGATT